MIAPFDVYDGCRSTAIRRGLEPPLRALRDLLDVDIALVLHVRSAGRAVVLATDCASDVQPPLINEEIEVSTSEGRALSLYEPRALQDVVLTSRGRSWRVAVASGIAVPWASAGRSGVVVLGTLVPRWASPPLDVAVRHRDSLAAAHQAASARGSAFVASQLKAACKALDRAELEATEPH